jgi:mannose-6-phosphate isomerase-like protein (cupin superfamily)
MSESFSYIPGADLEILMGPTRGDRAVRVVDIGRGAQLGAYILHYERMNNEEPNSFYHSEINEVYYVIRGEGTALLGGRLENPAQLDPGSFSFRTVTGPTVRGRMSGYTEVDWGPGDVIIVPAGVPHMIGWQVREPNDILRVVYDPNSRLDRVTNRAESLAQDRARQQAQGGGLTAMPDAKAPANMPGTFSFIPKAELETLMTGRISDTPVRVISAGNDSQLGVYLLHMSPREAPTGDVNSFYHAEISELYYVVRGAGTVLLGGGLENATWDDSNSRSIRTVRGPSVNGVLMNAERQPISAGDIVIVAAGVPHAFTYDVAEETDIVRIVIDPNKVLDPK